MQRETTKNRGVIPINRGTLPIKQRKTKVRPGQRLARRHGHFTSAGTGGEGAEKEQTFANVRYDDGDFEQLNIPETESCLVQN